MGVAVLALPFLAAGFEAHRIHFLSNQHAHLIAKALLVLDRGRVELIGFVYPPLPFLLMLPRPHPLWASTLSGVLGGAIAWILVHRLVRAGLALWQVVLVMLGALLTPVAFYLATQALNHTLMLLLLLLAWVYFLRFTRQGYTRAGFVTGMLLGLAFFVNHHAWGFALGYALAAPIFLKERTPGRILAVVFVLLFPVLWAAFVWMYVNWVFTGHPLTFLHHPESSLFVYSRAFLEEPIVGWPLALRSTLEDLKAVPLYGAVALVVLVTHPRRIGVYLLSLLLITTVRAWGMVYEPAFARSTYLVIALAALPRNLAPRYRALVVVLALVHLPLAWLGKPAGEMRAWQTALLQNAPLARDREEMDIGRVLAAFPPQRVLMDDRAAYRLVARTGTARPFLLPADALYPFAVSAPDRYVDALVVPTRPLAHLGGPLLETYVERPPAGFLRARVWREWQLYLREGSQLPAP